MKYVSRFSPYIQQEVDFLTVSMIAYAVHYANKIEAKKRKSTFWDQGNRSNIWLEVASRRQKVNTPFKIDSTKARLSQEPLLERQKAT